MALHPSDTPLAIDNAGTALNLPDTRDCYRVRIPITLRLPPVRLSHDEFGVRATLIDISRVGAAVLASSDTPLSRGRLVRCEIDLNDLHLHVDAEIRSAVTLKNHLRLGLRFVGLLPLQRQRVENMAASLERSALRSLHPAHKPRLRT